jgi:hypothetical protein
MAGNLAAVQYQKWAAAMKTATAAIAAADEARQLLREAQLPVKVKNTFIDDFVNEADGDELLEVQKVMSCPPLFPSRRRLVALELLLEEETENGDEAVAESGGLASLPPPPAPTFRKAGVVQSPRSSLDASAVSCGSPSSASTGSTTCVPIVPLPLRQPENSLGSQLHDLGECRPCAWFWRPQGCSNGEECRHCHLCTAGAMKTRRKARVAEVRAGAKAQQRVL